MIIKIQKILHCSSEHPNFPASNLLHIPSPGPWKCAKPGEMMATITFELPEPACIIGIDIGNFRTCVVLVDAATSSDPDNWIPLVNHQFLTHDEAANNKFRDQVQLFTKKELNPDTLQIKFNRVKVSCMQSANRRELFGLSSFILRAEVVVDMGLNVFGRFKMKADNAENSKANFKEKYLRLFPEKQKTYKEDLVEKIKENTVKNFNSRQEVEKTPKKRPHLDMLGVETSDATPKNGNGQLNGTSGPSEDAVRTPFGDIIPESAKKKNNNKKTNCNYKLDESIDSDASDSKHTSSTTRKNSIKKCKDKPQDNDDNQPAGPSCSKCAKTIRLGADELCKKCNKLPPPGPIKLPKEKKSRPMEAPKKLFSQLFSDVKFSLSGYMNPQREIIRKKAMDMGAQYIANPDTTRNKCTHLICAFKNTPKSQLLGGHAKIVSHEFIEDCFHEKKRLPWRRYAWSKREKKQPESEDEIESTTSPVRPNVYEQDTDPETDDEDY